MIQSFLLRCGSLKYSTGLIFVNAEFGVLPRFHALCRSHCVAPSVEVNKWRFVWSGLSLSFTKKVLSGHGLRVPRPLQRLQSHSACDPTRRVRWRPLRR